jgi:hypothetical protein
MAFGGDLIFSSRAVTAGREAAASSSTQSLEKLPFATIFLKN